MLIQPKPLWIALQFLTRLPIELSALPSSQQQQNSLYYYPLVGLLLGLSALLAAYLASGLDPRLAAWLLWLGSVLITGALHLDGLADSADAWLGGYGSVERSLSIMQDPRCGPAGVLSLLLVGLGKWLGLWLLLEQQQLLPLLLIPLLSRSLLPWLFWSTPYLRQQGLGQHFQSLQLKPLLLSLAASLLLCWLSGEFVLFISAWLSFYLLRRLMLQRLGGTTGDTAGALVEITELVLLLVAASQLN